MKSIGKKYAIALVAVAVAACMDVSSPDSSLLSVSDAFAVLPAGFSATTTSYTEGNGIAPAFMPQMTNEHGGPGAGPGGLLGGGLGADLIGGVGPEKGYGKGPFGGGPLNSSCVLNASTGRVVCAAETHDGLTINRSFAFTTAAGTVQAKPDSTTNTANSQVTAAGTVTRHDSSVSTVSHASNRTVTGLAYNSTLRTVNGTASGAESTKGKNKDGAAFTSTRAIGDTIKALTIPVVSGKPTYPSAGTVIRQMKVSTTVAGATTAHDRREVITYNGTATASIVITQDGTTKTCTLPLPHGKPSC